MTVSGRRIDHLVLAVDDLDGEAASYAAMGFQVGSRNRHPWGTENRIVQFRSSFLELITVADPDAIPPHSPDVFSFGAFVRDRLAEHEGVAMIALDSSDATADAAAFRADGISTHRAFSFQREGSRPDGTTTRVGFTLAFATDPRLPRTGFFVCQQLAPDAFWNPELQRHPHGATDITAVTVAVPEPRDHRDFLTAFTGASAADDGAELARGGRLELATARGLPGVTGFTVAVDDPAVLVERLGAHGIAHQHRAERVVVDRTCRSGVVRLEFVARRPQSS